MELSRETAAHQTIRRKKKKLWTCDVCKIRKFEDFDEACQHEEECRQAQQQQAQQEQDQQEGTVNERQLRVRSSADTTKPEFGCENQGSNDIDEEVSRKKRRTSKESMSDNSVPISAADKSQGMDNDGIQVVEVNDSIPNDKSDEDCDHVLNFVTDTSDKPSSRGRKKRKSSDQSIEREEDDIVEIIPSKSKENREKTNMSVALSQCESHPTTSKTDCTNKTTTKKATTGNWLSAATAANRRTTTRARRGASANTRGLDSDDVVIIEKPSNKKKSTKQSTKKTKAGPKTGNKEMLPTKGLFDGMSSQEVLAQQRIAEFQAKRLVQQQQEKDRRIKREKAREAPKEPAQANAVVAFLGGKSSRASIGKKTTSGFQAKLQAKQREEKARDERRLEQQSAAAQQKGHDDEKHQKPKKVKNDNKYAAPRFPNPTHVVQPDNPNNPEACKLSAVPWQPCYRNARTIPLDTAQNASKPINLLLPEERQTSFPCESQLTDSRISPLLAKILSHAKICHTVESSESNQLLPDKHRISADDLENPARGIGDSLCHAGVELFNFVEGWKKERHRANQRTEERQRRLAARNKSTKSKRNKRKTKDTEEELWGSENESSSLVSLFVLTGPVSSGKTSLVHAIGVKSECQVLEINTSDKRGGAALKQMLEEATVSHSSLDLLKQKQRKSLFAEQLVDSDESDSDVEEGANLAIVLIDEVDLLFENNGDNAFWPALQDLAKKAKCPIVLTANTLPAYDLRNFAYQHVRVEKPDLNDCVVRMRHILIEEGIDIGAAGDEALPTLAEFLNLDMRRFCFELESLKACDKRTLQKASLPTLYEKGDNPACPLQESPSLPFIHSVWPQTIDPTQSNALVVRGEGLLSLVDRSSEKDNYGYKVSGFLGDQICAEAKVLNEGVAVLACGTIHQKKTEEKAPFLDNEIESIFQLPVALRSCSKRGLISITDEALSVESYGDGTTYLSMRQSPRISIDSSRDTKSEEINKRRQEDASIMFRKQIEDLISSGEQIKDLVEMDTLAESSCDMDECERMTMIASDVALLKNENDLGGIPFLSGSFQGFGFDLTGESPQHANGKPPSESKLFELGWKDNFSFYGSGDAFVTGPLTRYELNQLKIAALEGRFKNKSVPTRDRKDQEDEEEWIPQHAFEEDCFIPNCVSAHSRTLPSSFTTSIMDASRPFEFSQTRRLEQWTRLLNEVFLFVDVKRFELFGRSQCRHSIETISTRDQFDARIVLDYIPMLRQMASFQAAAERFASQSGARDDTNSGERSTRSKQSLAGNPCNHFSLQMDYFQGHGRGRMNVKTLIDGLAEWNLASNSLQT